MSIQYLGTGENAGTLSRRTVQTFIASGTVTAGDWVMFDTSKSDADRVLYVKQALDAGTLGQTLTVGVALQTSASGATVLVVTSGYVEGAAVATAVTKGQPIIVGTTAGRARLAVVSDGTTAGDYIPCGIALENAASNTCDVWVLPRFQA